MLLDLPEVPLPGLGRGDHPARSGRPASPCSPGCTTGSGSATIVICVGAANALANPKRLLRSVPPALYEIGTALVVAVTVLPQFADSARRVRAAQSLRAGETGRVGRLRRFLVPVLEDALERSLALAAGMDARGYGRAGRPHPGSAPDDRRADAGRPRSASASASYAVLDRTAPRYLALPMLAVGTVAAVVGLLSAGRRVERARYRPDPWRWPELAVAASGVVAGAPGLVGVAAPGAARLPRPLDVPRGERACRCSAALVALGGGLCAPPPATPYAVPVPARQEVAA